MLRLNPEARASDEPGHPASTPSRLHAGSRTRRARSLVAYWEGGELVLENYLTGTQSQVSPAVLGVLDRSDDYREAAEALADLATVPDAVDLLARLVETDLLVVEDSPLDRRERRVEDHWRWGADARFFHFSTQRTLFHRDAVVQRDALVELARHFPQPSPFRDRGDVDVALPPPKEGPAGEFWDVLGSRRTRRRFDRTPIPLESFSELLRWTWGRAHLMSDPALGPYILKTSPSGGARHPIEAYPVVLRVEGLDPGVYHYSVRHHGLTLLTSGDFEPAVVEVCAGQESARDAAVVVFMTAVLERSMWKYGHSHAYRVVQLDAGHLGQTFHLVCTALGLAPFTTAALDYEGVEAMLGVDDVGEVAVYAALTGPPVRGAAASDTFPLPV